MRRHKLAVYENDRRRHCRCASMSCSKGDLDSGWDLNSTRIFMNSEQDQWIPGDGSIPCGRPEGPEKIDSALRPNHARAKSCGKRA